MPMETPQGTWVSRASADVLRERDSGAAGFQIPNSGFETAPSHVMAADVLGTIVDLGGAFEIVMQNARRNIIGENGPDGCGPRLRYRRDVRRR